MFCLANMCNTLGGRTMCLVICSLSQSLLMVLLPRTYVHISFRLRVVTVGHKQGPCLCALFVVSFELPLHTNRALAETLTINHFYFTHGHKHHSISVTISP